MNMRFVLLTVVAVLVASVPAHQPRAQTYPVKPIRFVVPAPAGRLLAEDFERAMLMGGRSTKTQDWSSRRG